MDNTNRNRKKRLIAGLGTAAGLASAATLVLGITFGLFSATQTSGNNVVTTGTVSVGNGSPASVTCNTANMVPGDSSTGYGSLSAALTQCTFNVKYTGSAPAYLGVDVAVTSPNTTSTALYDGTASGLQLKVKDGTPTTYINATSWTDQSGTSHTLSAGTPVTDLLVSTTPASANQAVSFTVDYGLALTSGNAYQNADAKVVLTFHAVQSGNNTVPGACAAGHQCSGLTWS